MGVLGFDDLRRHVGHKIECVVYGERSEVANVSLECVTCSEVLLGYDSVIEDSLGTSLPEVDLVKLDRVWERMNKSERYGCKFGLFPAWIEEYRLSHDEITELMKKSEPFLGVNSFAAHY